MADIADSMQAMEARHRAELAAAEARTRAAIEAKDRFLAIASHELRTPLNGILGMLQLVQATRLEQDQREQLRIAMLSAEALLVLVNNMLDVGLLQSERIPIDQHVFRPLDLAHDCLALVSPRAGEKHLQMRLSPDPSLPAALRGDPVRIRQILLNLLTNAVTFTPPGGSVELALSAADPTQGGLRCTVTDSGIGIAATRLPGLFAPFAQAEDSTTRSAGGSGLGLTICRLLAEAMGGSISVTSQPGRGSVFTVILGCPRAEAGLVGETQATALPGQRFRARVLVVDDQEINRNVAQGLLRALGCTVELAEGGLAAVAACAAARYDLVLMDVHMPELDGHAATARIRAADAAGGRRTPIVALSASAFAVDRAASTAAGLDGHLAKPLRADDLVVVLLRHAPHSRCDAHLPDITPIGGLPILPAAGAPGTRSYVDGVQLLRLSRQFGPGGWQLLRELVDIFELELDRHVAGLQRCAQANDIQGLGKEAHRLRGQALALAAVRLADACESIELSVDRGNWSEATAALSGIERISRRSLAVLRELVRAAPDETRLVPRLG